MKGQDQNSEAALTAMERLHGAAIRLLRSMRPLDAQAGLSGPKLSVLSVLVFGGPASLSALAETEQVRRPTMTQLVNALEAEGLVRKRAGGTDRRSISVEATTRGRKLLRLGRARRLGELVSRFQKLSPAERKALLGSLDALETLARGETRSKR